MHKMMVILGAGAASRGFTGQGQWDVDRMKAALGARGLRRMVRNTVQESVRRAHMPASEQVIAVVEELWFDTEPVREDLDALLRPTGAHAVLQAAFVREHVVFRRPVGDKSPIKRLSLLQRRADISPREFSNYWEHVHGPLAHCHRHVALYVQNHPAPLGTEPLLFDGIAEFQITDLAAMQTDYRTQEGISMRADVANFASTVSTYLVVAREFPCALG
jgi:uncharacterized protein (TIGR02118 family)